MKKSVNNCCHCATDGYPCAGDTCSNRNAVELICDQCKAVVEELYDTEHGEVCESCLIENTLNETPKIA